ncbi:MAG: TetR/AcrR family transcriptional regulator [Pseudomonadales bacterium]|nr:TetR/AcrR family transcriptional regulator [Pseudomonadales bacterium]
MNTLTRRQREFQQREQLFLDTARSIIRAQGFHALTMEKIAAETEYAKGTIYKHFANKEDLVLALCTQALSYMVRICQAMEQFPGTPREKLAVVGVAYQVYAEKFPEEFDLIMEARAGNLREKASEERIAFADQTDGMLMALIRQQIDDAISQGHLSIPGGLGKDDICFGLWSLSFGVSVLQQASDLLHNMDLAQDQNILSLQLSCLLDGYQWKPLSSDMDYLGILESAQNYVLELISVFEKEKNTE